VCDLVLDFGVLGRHDKIIWRHGRFGLRMRWKWSLAHLRHSLFIQRFQKFYPSLNIF